MLRLFRGATALPAPAGEGQRGAPRGPGRGERPLRLGQGRTDKGWTETTSDATTAVPGSRGEGVGGDLLLSPGAAPLSPLAEVKAR